MDDEIVRNWDVHQHGLYRDADHGKGSLVESTTDMHDNTLLVDDAVLFGHQTDLLVGTIQSIEGNQVIIHGALYDRDYTRLGRQLMRFGSDNG